MRKIQLILSLALLVAIGFVGCVPQRKFAEMKTAREESDSENKELQRKLDNINAATKEQGTTIETLKKSVNKLNEDTLLYGKEYRRLRVMYDKVNDLNNELLSKNETLLNSSQDENKKLLRDLEKAKEALQVKEDSLYKLEKSVKEKQAALAKAQSDLFEREVKIKELDSLLQAQRSASELLRAKLESALLNYKNKGITVREENGKVYVSMEAQLLFPSGKTEINGTTGYEEAAGQGIIAGINAGLFVQDKAPFILRRDEAYIGVLIDDLITKSTDEPYRMFTSRAEYRTLLRQDNADERLTPLSHAIGLASNQRLELLEKKRENIKSVMKVIEKTSTSPEEINELLQEKGSAPIDQKLKLINLLTRPHVSLEDIISKNSVLEAQISALGEDRVEIVAAVEIAVKYAGYLQRERDMADKLTRLDHIQLSPEFDYLKLTSMSIEARQKLSKIRPATVGQASRISGVNPSDVSILLIHLGR